MEDIIKKAEAKEQAEYVQGLLDSEPIHLDDVQRILVNNFKKNKGAVDLSQVRLLQMIDEAQSIQRSITEFKGAMKASAEMLWMHKKSMEVTDEKD